MEFKKYNEIENHYRDKYLKKFEDFTSRNDVFFVLLEKLDGSNFSVKVDPEGNMKFGKRKSFLDDENFYGFQDVCAKYDFSTLKHYAKFISNTVTVYGELFGKGIQKRIDYGDKKHLAFYDIYIDGRYLPFYRVEEMLKSFRLPIVPVIAKELTFNQAMDFNVEGINSKFLDSEDNQMEGVIIRPQFSEIYVGHDRLILKKKSEKFKENHNKKKKKISPMRDEANQWREIVNNYVTENRLFSLFSKEGEIDDPKQIGSYIKMYKEDLMNSFYKDYPEFDSDEFSKKEMKHIFGIEKQVVKMLNKYL